MPADFLMTFKPTRNRVDPEKVATTPLRRPEWIHVRAPQGETQAGLQELMRRKHLHSVCEEAFCPNLGECWGSGTATFLILGNICTRACSFCDIKHGKPEPLDRDEPQRVAQAVKAMGLKHAVITSVDRDDCPDGGAAVFAEVIQQIHALHPGCSIEVLIPDFKGDLQALKKVVAAKPDIVNHNLETVPRLFRKVQPQDRLEWSERILRSAKSFDPQLLTKSGIMVGLGETPAEVRDVISLIRSWDVDILTIGQYLQPSRRHLPIERYYTPAEFSAFKEFGQSIGFHWVESAPLVRSSYHAAEQVRILGSRPTPRGIS
jgi:lipoic acid synthetase